MVRRLPAIGGPPHGLVAEIIHGVLITQPRPAAPHALATSRLGIKLGAPYDLLEVQRLDGGTYRVVGVWRDEAVVRPEPFDAIELDLASLWVT